MIEAFVASFALNFLAELGDKTQLAAFMLSTKFKQKHLVFAGVSLALAAATLISVGIGSLVATMVPHSLLDGFVGACFMLFGAYTIHESNKKEEVSVDGGKRVFISSFALVFFMELGDKSQMANVFLSTKFDPVGVYLGAVAALTILSLLAVAFGGEINKRVSHSITGKIAGAVSILMGALLILGYL